jgi:hypothetical protein
MAKNPNQMISVIDEVHSLRCARAKSFHLPHRREETDDYFLAVFECHSTIFGLSVHRPELGLYEASFIAGFLIPTAFSGPDGSFLRCCLLVLEYNRLAELFLQHCLHLPPRCASVLAGLAKTAWHVKAVNAAIGSAYLGFSDFVKTTGWLFAFELGLSELSRCFFNKLYFGSVVSDILTFLFAARIFFPAARSGFEVVFERILDSALYHNPSPQDNRLLPVETHIPTQFQCGICRDLAREPVVADGFIFCAQCLTRWLQQSPVALHPVTGRTLLAQPRPSYIHKHFCSKFMALKLANLSQ